MNLLCTILLTFLSCWNVSSQSIKLEKDGISLTIKPELGNLQLNLQEGGNQRLSANLGRTLQNHSDYAYCQNVANCIEFENGTVRLHVMDDIDKGFTIYWISKDASKVIEDCYSLSNHNWFGGPERYEQHWPIQRLILRNFANVLQEKSRGAIAEPYWLNSVGAYIFVNKKVPLFINQNTLRSINQVCYSAKIEDPYPSRKEVVLHYTIVAEKDSRVAHLHAVKHFLGKPSGHPNYRIIENPIWSTWARYKRDINDEVILQFAKEIIDNGYSGGQFEIDDHWEECYGALTFNQSRFGDINNSVAKIKNMNFTVTLWIHPFVSIDCKKYQEVGRRYDYFVKNSEGSDLTKWWNSKGDDAHYLDFTKEEVRSWFIERLRNIQRQHGIDSFKFDAGETSWAPQVSVLNGDVNQQPNNLAVDYVRTCATFADLIEIRTGWKTQDLPVFVRMIDKDSVWGIWNGLRTLITTLLQMNLNGYTLVLPDMVGGNGYSIKPNAELFVRWLQANTFMPSIQFSYVPWDYDKASVKYDVKVISKKFVQLHQKVAPYILKTMQKSIEHGHPVNSPIWWVSPDDPLAQKESTEFLLGEDILVAPILIPWASSRRVYLPEGRWVDGNNGAIYEGPLTIKKYKAPIDVLPYFVREESEAFQLLIRSRTN